MTVANENGAPLALIGDRAQLPAIGRGGVLDMAVAAHPRPLDLSELCRFREAGYADLTLQMRGRADPKALFDNLEARGNIVVHATAEKPWEGITAEQAAIARRARLLANPATTARRADRKASQPRRGPPPRSRRPARMRPTRRGRRVGAGSRTHRRRRAPRRRARPRSRKLPSSRLPPSGSCCSRGVGRRCLILRNLIGCYGYEPLSKNEYPSHCHDSAEWEPPNRASLGAKY